MLPLAKFQRCFEAANTGYVITEDAETKKRKKTQADKLTYVKYFVMYMMSSNVQKFSLKDLKTVSFLYKQLRELEVVKELKKSDENWNKTNKIARNRFDKILQTKEENQAATKLLVDRFKNDTLNVSTAYFNAINIIAEGKFSADTINTHLDEKRFGEYISGGKRYIFDLTRNDKDPMYAKIKKAIERQSAQHKALETPEKSKEQVEKEIYEATKTLVKRAEKDSVAERTAYLNAINTIAEGKFSASSINATLGKARFVELSILDNRFVVDFARLDNRFPQYAKIGEALKNNQSYKLEIPNTIEKHEVLLKKNPCLVDSSKTIKKDDMELALNFFENSNEPLTSLKRWTVRTFLKKIGTAEIEKFNFPAEIEPPSQKKDSASLSLDPPSLEAANQNPKSESQEKENDPPLNQELDIRLG